MRSERRQSRHDPQGLARGAHRPAVAREIGWARRRLALLAGAFLTERGQPLSVRIGHMVARQVPKLVAVAIGLIAIACAGRDARSPNPGADERVFAAVMDRIAKGWNTGDAAGAADCFTVDAVYMEPPDRQKYVGRRALFEFFGGHERPPPKMKMTWHHLAF